MVSRASSSFPCSFSLSCPVVAVAVRQHGDVAAHSRLLRDDVQDRGGNRQGHRAAVMSGHGLQELCKEGHVTAVYCRSCWENSIFKNKNCVDTVPHRWRHSCLHSHNGTADVPELCNVLLGHVVLLETASKPTEKRHAPHIQSHTHGHTHNHTQT